MEPDRLGMVVPELRAAALVRDHTSLPTQLVILIVDGSVHIHRLVYTVCVLYSMFLNASVLCAAGF